MLVLQMIQVLDFGIHLTPNDSAGRKGLGRQRLFQLPSEIPGLPLQKLARGRSSRF